MIIEGNYQFGHAKIAMVGALNVGSIVMKDKQLKKLKTNIIN